MPVLHAGMVGLVQITDHYSLAYARLDTPVTAAKRRVNNIFENVLHVFSLFSHFYPRKAFITNSAMTSYNFKIYTKIP